LQALEFRRLPQYLTPRLHEFTDLISVDREGGRDREEGAPALEVLHFAKADGDKVQFGVSGKWTARRAAHGRDLAAPPLYIVFHHSQRGSRQARAGTEEQRLDDLA
jgi:hypothetical protein